MEPRTYTFDQNQQSTSTAPVFGYQVEGRQGWLSDTQCNLGINNPFDQRPSFVNQFELPSGTVGYDAANATVVGRQVSLQLVKRWGR